MKQSIFEFKDYKKYLNDALDDLKKQGHASRSDLAKASQCQTAYVSQVLNGSADFSLEQADRINAFMGHSTEEGDFFFLLIQLGRAGSHSLKEYFQRQINRVHENRLELKNRLDVNKTLSKDNATQYYSQWYYSAIHVMLTIPEFQSKEKMAKYLRMSESRVAEVLEFLTSVGLATKTQGKYKIGTTRIHLPADSPMISKHHTNWRLNAIRSMERESLDDTHYSSVVTLSRADVMVIRSKIIEFIQEIKVIIRDSKEEEVHSFCLDFFRT